MGIAIYILTFAFILTGLYVLVSKKNLIRIIIGLAMLGYGVILFLVLIGYRHGGIAPILGKRQEVSELLAKGVDPLPQAMVLTAIVIELSVTALAVALAIRLYEKYRTFDMNDIRRLRG